MIAETTYAIPARRTSQWRLIGGESSPNARAAHAIGLDGAICTPGDGVGAGAPAQDAASGALVSVGMVATTSPSTPAGPALERARHLPRGATYSASDGPRANFLAGCGKRAPRLLQSLRARRMFVSDAVPSRQERGH